MQEINTKIGECRYEIQEHTISETHDYVNKLLNDLGVPDMIQKVYSLEDSLNDMK